MADTTNSTKVQVEIGAANTAGAVIQQAMGEFGGLWKKIAEGGPASIIGVAAVAAVAVAVGSAIKQAGDFQQQIVRLSTSAGESQANLKLVSDGILKIARDSGTATQQLTDGMYQVESAGFHGAAALKVLAAAAEGAKTENADLGKVTDAVTSALVDYHLPADQAANVTSRMIAAVSQGKSTFESLTGALHSVLPIASAAHVSMNDILGDLASMTVHGMSADQATQNLAQAIRKMQAPTAAMRDYLGGLGINAADLSGKLSKQGLSGTLEEISKAIMDHMGPAGKVLTSAFNQSKSAAQDANAMIAAMPKSLKALAESFANGKTSLADFHKAVKELPTTQANLMTQFASLENKAQGFNQQLKSGSPAAKTYSQALQAATGDATTFNVALMLTGENAAYTSDAVKAVGAAHADARGHVEGWSQVQGEFNLKLAQLGEIAQTGAIKLGTVLLPAATLVLDAIVHLADFSVNLGKIFHDVMEGLGKATKAAGDIISKVFQDVEGWLKKHKKGIEEIVGVLTVIFLPLLVKLGVQAAVTAAIWVAQFALMAARAVATGIVNTVQAAISGAVWVFNAIKSGVAWTVQFAIMAARSVATAIIFTAQAAVGGYAWVFQATKASAAWLVAFPRMAAEGVGTAAKFVAQAVVAGATWIAQATLVAIRWAISFAAMIAGAVAAGAAQLVAGAVAAIGWLLALGPILLVIAAIAVVAGLAYLVITHWKDVLGFFQGLGALVLRAIGGFGSLLYNVGRDMIQGLINGVVSMVSAAGNAIKNVGNGLVGGLKNILGIHSPSTVFAEIGQNMGHGLIQGLNGIKAQANVAVTGLVTGTGLVNSNGSPATSSNVSNTTVHNVMGGSANTTINVTLGTAPAVQEFFRHLNQDSLSASRGLTPVQGRA